MNSLIKSIPFTITTTLIHNLVMFLKKKFSSLLPSCPFKKKKTTNLYIHLELHNLDSLELRLINSTYA